MDVSRSEYRYCHLGKGTCASNMGNDMYHVDSRFKFQN